MHPLLLGPRRRAWHIALAVAVVFLAVRIGIDAVAVGWLHVSSQTLLTVHLLTGAGLAFLLTYFALRHRASDQMEQITRLQSLLVDQTHDSIITTDQGGFITTWNRGSERMFGYSAEEAIGKHVAMLFPVGLERHKWLDVIAPVLETGKNSIDSKCLHRTGRVLETNITLSVLVDQKKEPIGMIGHLMDITERKQAEQEQKKLQDQLRHASKMEAVGKLAGGVAHDFNNLLSVILGYSEILLYESRHLSDADRARLHQVRRSGERAAALTRQLLAFSRKQVLQPVIVDLNELMGELQKMLARLVPNNIRLQVVNHDEMCPVRVDPGQIEQVIINLVVNARDAMPEGGELAIETSHVTISPSESPGRGVPAGDYAAVTVRDSGCGMDEATMGQIFEPFFTTKEQGKGTGIGLATVHGIVQQSGGQVTVESEVGKGSAFRVLLPLMRAADVRGRTESPEVMLPRGEETILLVEDEVAVREVARDVLLSRGYRVMEARNGEEAIQLAQQYCGPIHLTVSDMVMPGIPTRVLVDTLRRARPEMKWLFTSGYSEAFIKDGFEEAGSLLQKPFTLHDLVQRVRERLDGEGHREQRMSAAGD